MVVGWPLMTPFVTLHAPAPYHPHHHPFAAPKLFTAPYLSLLSQQYVPNFLPRLITFQQA